VKSLLVAIMLAVAGLSMCAQAADSNCESKAAEKHLSGAAKNSFVTKCEKQAKAEGAKAQCDSQETPWCGADELHKEVRR